jgi:hypothetical protein
MARDEIADFHRMLNKQGDADGGSYVFKNEYVAALETFCREPNIDNARNLIEAAPPLLRYFEDCTPGNSSYEMNAYLKSRGLKK